MVVRDFDLHLPYTCLTLTYLTCEVLVALLNWSKAATVNSAPLHLFTAIVGQMQACYWFLCEESTIEVGTRLH